MYLLYILRYCIMSFVFRKNDGSGTIFGLIFDTHDKDKFEPSNIGEGIVILKPCLEGKWANMKLITSSEPCFLYETN